MHRRGPLSVGEIEGDGHAARLWHRVRVGSTELGDATVGGVAVLVYLGIEPIIVRPRMEIMAGERDARRLHIGALRQRWWHREGQ